LLLAFNNYMIKTNFVNFSLKMLMLYQFPTFFIFHYSLINFLPIILFITLSSLHHDNCFIHNLVELVIIQFILYNSKINWSHLNTFIQYFFPHPGYSITFSTSWIYSIYINIIISQLMEFTPQFISLTHINYMIFPSLNHL
jgi:hypothetical protein